MSGLLTPPHSTVVRALWLDALHRGHARMGAQLGLPPSVTDPAANPAPRALAYAWQRRFHGPTRKALRRAAQAFDDQPWRDELRRWEESLRPDLVMHGLRLAGTAPTQLSDRELAGFIGHCLDYIAQAVETAAALGLAGGVVRADFARACARWAGAATVDITPMLPGEGTLRAGARHELAAVREALAATTPLPLPAQGSADEALLDLADRRDALGRAVRAYLDRIRLRVTLPLELTSPTAWEQPQPILAVLEDIAGNLGRAAVASGASAAIAAMRERVPARQRDDFEHRVAQARAVQRLIEEPVHMVVAWGLGVTRQALLHAGDRLVRHGRLDAAERIFEALPEEVTALLSGTGPDSATLNERGNRIEAEPEPAVRAMPLHWLPAPARRVADAAGDYLAATGTQPRAGQYT